MGNLTVLIGGIFGVFLSKTVISIVFSSLTAMAYVLGRKISAFAAGVAAFLIAGVLGFYWAAFLFNSAEQLLKNEFAASWLVWVFAYFIAMLPIASAVESADKYELKAGHLTEDGARLRTALTFAGGFQFFSMLIFWFTDTALDKVWH